MQKQKVLRRFLGTVYTSTKNEDGLPIDKQERRFESKHLRAYLRGFERFIFGRYKDGSPKWHTVKQELIYV